MESKQIFYTINGRYLGVAFHDVEMADLYPSVCLQSQSEEVSSRFTRPFMFDLEAFREERMQNEFRKMWSLPCPEMSMRDMVKEYLVHYGYVETLQALDDKKQPDGDKEMLDLSEPIERPALIKALRSESFNEPLNLMVGVEMKQTRSISTLP